MGSLPTIDRKVRWQIAGYAVGLVLFVAAVVAVVVKRAELLEALATMQGAPAWMIAATVVLPLLNWIVVSISLWVLMRGYGRVEFVEMSALIANAWLLNYLPMRPGMAGRITYHKIINDIRVRDSAKVVLQATAMTGISIGLLGAMAAVLADRYGPAAWWIGLGAPIVALAIAAPSTPSPFWRRMVIALLLRHIDMLIWIARYWVVFAVLDVELGVAGAVIFAVVSQIALLVPFTGNGLGVREWCIGQTVGLGVIAGLDQGLTLGLTADLLNRAGELAASIPVGLIAAWWVARRLAAHGATENDAPESPEEGVGAGTGAETRSDR